MDTIKLTMVICIFTAAILTIGKIFWDQELKYTQPTPVPEDYNPVSVRQVLDLKMEVFQKSDKPKHLHFFNPDCPCSRFNLSHFSFLVKEYAGEIDFYIVIPSDDDLDKVAEEFNHTIPVIADAEEKLARICGVYSSPQAVLIDTNGKLFYRGNYNKARYCTNISSNYAQLAIDSLLAKKPAPQFGVLSTTAYGCELGEKSWLTFF